VNTPYRLYPSKKQLYINSAVSTIVKYINESYIGVDMAESISLYVSKGTRGAIEEIAEERYGTTTQKSVVVAEAIRCDMYYSYNDHDVTETPIVSKAKQVPAGQVPRGDYTTEDSDYKTNIRVSLPARLVDYLDESPEGRGYTLDNCMDLYTGLDFVNVDNLCNHEDDDEEEEDEQFEDVNEYLLKTDNSELTVEGVDAHEVKESSKYRIPYLLAKLNDEHGTELDIDRKDINRLISNTFTVSEPTRQRYRNEVYKLLSEYVVDVEEDNFVAQNMYSPKGRKAPASAGLNKIRVAQVINLADELLDSDEDKFDDVIQSYVDSYVDIEYEISDVIDDVIDVLQLYKSSEDLEYSFIDGRIDTVLLELKEF
jgi:hypothetical protein